MRTCLGEGRSAGLPASGLSNVDCRLSIVEFRRTVLRLESWAVDSASKEAVLSSLKDVNRHSTFDNDLPCLPNPMAKKRLCAIEFWNKILQVSRVRKDLQNESLGLLKVDPNPLGVYADRAVGSKASERPRRFHSAVSDNQNLLDVYLAASRALAVFQTCQVAVKRTPEDALGVVRLDVNGLCLVL